MILWSLRTTPNRSIGFTPFFLSYGAEAVLPSDLNHGAPRVKAFDQNQAAEAQQDAIDLLDEAHETTIIRSARYQQTLRRYHERKIRGRILEVGDLVLQRTQSTKKNHKLSPPWEGPYTVTEVIRSGTYRRRMTTTTFSPTHGTSNTYVIFPLNFVLPLFSQTLAPIKHPSPNTFSSGRSGAP